MEAIAIVGGVVLGTLALLGWVTSRVQRPVLTSEEAYDEVMQEIERLIDLDPQEGSKDGRRLDYLSDLAEAYEEIHYPMMTT